MLTDTAVIFGASGQDGWYLKQLLESRGLTVVAASRSAGFVQADVGDYKQVEALIRHHQPRYLFNLAADSTVSHQAMFENHHIISGGALNVLEACRLYAPGSKIFIAGSGLQFRKNDLPISEADPFEADDPYSVARIQSVYAARYFRNTFGMQVYTGYLFNHDSPRRTERHMTKKISAFAGRIGQGADETLEVGCLDCEKEYTFAGDVVEAIWTLVSQQQHHEAVIGSGAGYSISDWLTACFSIVGKDWRPHVVSNSGFRPTHKKLVSAPALIKSMGWQPKVNFEQLAAMMMQ
jgi:GDPmannose 4,6-dehydratase